MSESQPIFLKHFSEITDPRIQRSKKHSLTDIIAISICAIMSGIDTIEGIGVFAKAKEQWLRGFLSLPGGVPSHDTIGKLLGRILPGEFEAAFVKWVDDVVRQEGEDIVAIDGKTLRRSFDRASEKSPVHMVSAWAVGNGIVLGQRSVDEKSNEIKAIPTLLETLVIKGCVVTIDAMGCQRDICTKILEKEAEYCISLKGNQGSLRDDVEGFFELYSPMLKVSGPCFSTSTNSKGHGRNERRDYFISEEIDAIQNVHEWPGLRSIGLVRSTRILNGKPQYENRYFICSFAPDSEKFAKAVRGHWGVENALHWRLDVVFDEDQSRIRDDNSAENFSRLRRVSLNLLKKIPEKASIPKKRIQCALDDNYRTAALGGQVL